MSDSTAISALPAMQNNINLEITDKVPPATHLQGASHGSPNIPIIPTQAPQNNMNHVLQGLQQVQHRSMTQLPSRDIPMMTHQLTQDQQVKPNYIPSEPKADYIEQHDTYQTMMDKGKESQKEKEKMDSLYDELHLPVLIMVLFLLFQMPFVQKKLLQFFPSLFLKDGHMTMGGYFLKTALFGLLFYIIMKVSKYASEL
jgi:hypothetical protein